MSKTDIFKSWSERLIWLFVAMVFVGLWWGGIRNFYFHQDDVISLAMVVRGWPSVLWSPNAEHVNILFFGLLYLEWFVFGLNYPLYLAVSMVIWALILVLVYLIVKKGSKSKWLAIMAVGLLVINRNWGEMVWWVTGQSMMMATLFALLSWWYKLKLDEKETVPWYLRVLWGVSLIMPGLAWGGGLMWPFTLTLFYGWQYKNKKLSLKLPEAWMASILMLAIYLLIGGKSAGAHFAPLSWFTSPLQIVLFTLVGLVENVVGRWLWPFRDLWIKHIILLGILWWVIVRGFKQMILNKQVIFMFGVAIFSMFFYAIPRWQFGLPQAMAERYGFQPLIFGVIGLMIAFAKSRINTRQVILVTIVTIYIILVGSISFAKKAETWRERPLQVKAWFRELVEWRVDKCYPNDYLPHFLVENYVWRTDYIWPIFKMNFNPWEEKICK